MSVMTSRMRDERQEVEVNPFRCRMWSLHDRLEEYVSEETCKSEIESFLRHGQVVPALGRRLEGDPDFDVELIFGARRLFVARHLSATIRVHLVEMSDQQALIAMDIENRHRKDISPYERGLSFTRWLKAGLFESQEHLARALRISPSQVSRLVRLARLPSVILNAFNRPIDILEGWGVELANAWEDPQRRMPLLQKARRLQARSSRPAAHMIYEQLISGAGRWSRRRVGDPVLDDQQRPLFRVRRLRTTVVLSFPAESLSLDILEEIKKSVSGLLVTARARQSGHTTGASSRSPVSATCTEAGAVMSSARGSI